MSPTKKTSQATVVWAGSDPADPAIVVIRDEDNVVVASGRGRNVGAALADAAEKWARDLDAEKDAAERHAIRREGWTPL